MANKCLLKYNSKFVKKNTSTLSVIFDGYHCKMSCEHEKLLNATIEWKY